MVQLLTGRVNYPTIKRPRMAGACVPGRGPIPTGYTKQSWPKTKQTDTLQIGKIVVFSSACVLIVQGIMLPNIWNKDKGKNKRCQQEYHLKKVLTTVV